MTINAQDTIKVTLTGVRIGGEEWNTGFWCIVGPNGAMTQADLDEIRAEIAVLAVTQWSNVWDTQATVDTDFNKVHVAYYPAGSNIATLASEEAVTVAAGTSLNRHPYECCMVVSLRTAIPTRSGRGRMYLPLDGYTVVGGSQITNEAITAVADGMLSLFNQVNNITTPNVLAMAVAVASHTQGVARPVQQIIVDSLPDIQRRRGDSLTPFNVQTRAVTP